MKMNTSSKRGVSSSHTPQRREEGKDVSLPVPEYDDDDTVGSNTAITPTPSLQTLQTLDAMRRRETRK